MSGQEPTARQIEYAEELGISIPEGVSRAELSDLIDLAVYENDKPADWLVAYAAGLGIVTEQQPKKRLYSSIWFHLSRQPEGTDLCRWFVFRVLRDRERHHGGKGYGLSDPLVHEIAGHLVADKKLLSSVKRYDKVNFFGEFTTKTGLVLSGGSRRTAAYGAVVGLLKEMGIEAEKPVSPPAEAVNPVAAKGVQVRHSAVKPTMAVADSASGSSSEQGGSGLKWLGIAAFFVVLYFVVVNAGG
jgi:hypothetical protein